MSNLVVDRGDDTSRPPIVVSRVRGGQTAGGEHIVGLARDREVLGSRKLAPRGCAGIQVTELELVLADVTELGGTKASPRVQSIQPVSLQHVFLIFFTSVTKSQKPPGIFFCCIVFIFVLCVPCSCPSLPCIRQHSCSVCRI